MRTGNRGPNRGPGPAAPAGRRDGRRPARTVGGVRRRLAPQEWFAQQLLLVLSGQRPVHALLGHARPRAYDQLGRLAPGTPLRPPPGRRGAPVLRGVGVCRPSPDALEAFARITTGDRTRALAFRLERTPTGRWLCAAVELDTVR